MDKLYKIRTLFI